MNVENKSFNQTLISPRPIHINKFNGNSFFTIDYEPIHQKQFVTQDHFFSGNNSRMNQTTNIEKWGEKKKNDFVIKNAVKSAQYSRNLQTNKLRISLNNHNPYTRIKKVDQKIQSLKNQIGYNDYLNRQSKKLEKFPAMMMYSPKTAIIKNFQQQPKTKRHFKSHSLAQRTENGIQFYLNKQKLYDECAPKSLAPNKKFTQNYKNRRKLTDRITNRRNRNESYSVSPLKWKNDDSKNEQEKPKQGDKQQWDPHSGKLLIYHNPQLLRSIEGNKIKYSDKQVSPKAQNAVNFKRYDHIKFMKKKQKNTDQLNKSLSIDQDQIDAQKIKEIKKQQ